MGGRISVVDRSMRRTLPKSILLPIAGVANLMELGHWCTTASTSALGPLVMFWGKLVE